MRNKVFNLALVLLLGLGFAVDSAAGPAAMKVYELEQPDGTRFSVLNRGDEWNNWIETVDRYAIGQGNDGYWYYMQKYTETKALLDSTRADQPPPLHLEKHVRPTPLMMRLAPSVVIQDEELEKAPSGIFYGRILFILVEFNDWTGTYSESTWESAMAQIGDYFSDASYGKVTLVPAGETFGNVNNGVVGWLNVGYDHPNTENRWTSVNRLLARDAILAANPYVDFADYDTNDDGYVDADELAVVVVVAGYEESYSSAYSPSVWAHRWFVASPSPLVDGVFVDDGYAQVGEIHQSTSLNQHRSTVGQIVHELGHLIFGLPDLYDTDFSSGGIGAFGVMAYGAWGRASSDTYIGETPVLPCAWSKYNRGWVVGNRSNKETSVTASGSSNSTSSNVVYKVWAGRQKEYFLIENRQPQGYDRGLERWLGADVGGIAIWHIDDSLTSNKNDTHRLVDLEEADATEITYWNRGDKEDLWYSGNATTFNDTTDPNSKLYDGSSSGVEITDIGTSGETMTMTILPTVTKAMPWVPSLLLED